MCCIIRRTIECCEFKLQLQKILLNCLIHLSNHHFKDEHSQSPPVHRPCIRSLREHFWCKELWGAAERGGSVTEAHAFFTQTKVGNLHKAVGIQ